METPRSINQWAEQTFGPRTALEAAIRCNVELAELMSAFQNEADQTEVAKELADVYIVIVQVPEILGHDLATIMKGVEPLRVDTDTVEVGALVRRLNVHMAMLIEALASNAAYVPIGIREVMLDINLLADYCDIELQDEVDAKMAVNRAREWGKTDNGRFQHK